MGTPIYLNTYIILGLANIRVGKTVELLLETCDNNGDPLERGGELIKGELLHRSAGIPRDITVKINDLRNGKYLLSFIPDVVGKLLLNVYVKGQPIKVSRSNFCFSKTIFTVLQ